MKLLGILFSIPGFKKKTVFVSGVFDIVHAGHIEFLYEAKKLAGLKGQLVVAVHDDVSVRKHKGESRPIHSLEDRIKVLEALKPVDKVVPWYGWKNISNLVYLIEPDYIAVSGDEYKAKTLRKFIKDLNTELVVFPRYKDLSTTRVIEKLCEEQKVLHEYK